MEPRSPGRLSLMLVSGIIFLFWVSLYVYVPVLPVYATQVRGASLQVAGLIVSSYGLSQLILRVPYGYWSDRLKRRKAFVALGLALSVAGGLGLAVAPNPALLVLFRFISGAGAATWVISTVWLASLFPAHQAVRAAGLASFLSGLGQVLASGWGGALAQTYGWSAPFYVAAAIGLLALLCLPVVKERWDGESSAASQPARQALSAVDRPLLIISLATAVAQFATYATSYGFVPILAADLGASRAQLGGLTTAMQIPNVLASIAIGLVALSSRSEKLLSLLGLGAMAAASLWVLNVHSLQALLLTRVLHGLGLGLSYSILTGLAIKHVPAGRRALAMGVFQAVYALGMFAGPALSGFIASGLGIQVVFLFSGLLALAFLPILSWGMGRETVPYSLLNQN